MKAVVVGMGNPYFGNDAAGIRVAELVAEWMEKEKHLNIDVVYLSTTSFEVIDKILGYDKAFIVDTLMGEENGRVHIFSFEGLDGVEGAKKYHHTSHALSLTETLKLGYELFPDEMPDVEIIAIEIVAAEPSTCCSKEVDGAVDRAFHLLQQKLLMHHSTE